MAHRLGPLVRWDRSHDPSAGTLDEDPRDTTQERP